jgi:hypothetical protein
VVQMPWCISNSLCAFIQKAQRPCQIRVPIRSELYAQLINLVKRSVSLFS